MTPGDTKQPRELQTLAASPLFEFYKLDFLYPNDRYTKKKDNIC